MGWPYRRESGYAALMQPMPTEELYELAPEPESRPAARPAAPVTTLDGPAPLAYRPPERADDGEVIRNLHLPLWLLAGGLVVELAMSYGRSPNLNDAAIGLLLGVLGRTVVMLVAMLIAARFRGIDLGSFPTAVLKLAAVAVGPSAVVTLLTPLLGTIPSLPTAFEGVISLGWLLGLAVLFGLHYALIGALFDLDESDTWYCVMVMFIVGVAAHFARMALS